MKKPTKKQKRLAGRKRNPFAREGWRSFVVRRVLADQAARARVTVTGETLHWSQALRDIEEREGAARQNCHWPEREHDAALVFLQQNRSNHMALKATEALRGQKKRGDA